ncbi:MAG: ATP-dependent DNA helicase RecQ, partial [Gemmatimonadota bacterium]
MAAPTSPDFAPRTSHPLAERLDTARALLARHWGFPDFRPAQRRVVQSILAGRDTLAILPTGGGKSLCFQVPALVLDGLTLVVSPLLALMQDQVNALQARGIAAAALNSLLKAPQQAEVMERVKSGELKLLYVSPERLERLSTDLAAAKVRPVLLAVDEAHCLVEWGHDFRPAYRRLGRLRWKLGRPPVVALTGSATPEVRDDIAATLRLGAWGATRGRWDLHLGSFDRPNLWFGVVAVRSERDRWDRLLALLRTEDRTTLVYVPTRGLAEGIARGLSARGIAAAPFHAGLPAKDRKATLRRFLEDEVEVVVATCAFGMGIDKPTVRLVVHWTLPPTPESYYQEAGRGGRDGRSARCVLLHHPDDATLHRRQLDVTFPPRDQCEQIWSDPQYAARAPRNVRESAERLRRELHPERGGVDWRPVAARRERALARLCAIERYAATRGCRRAALVKYFGETLLKCAGCASCRGELAARPLDPEARKRFRALRSALAPVKTPWGGAVLEPEVMARLAETPPSNAAALAAEPGVGSEICARLGARILEALGVVALSASPVETLPPLLKRL